MDVSVSEREHKAPSCARTPALLHFKVCLVMQERVQKIISKHGIASRREAERMINAGRVTVNGTPATVGQSARFGIDEIAVDGNLLVPAGDMIYIMLNKPKGYLTTTNDERGRKTVMSLVSQVGVRIYPVGRLDMDTEGLLLLTNDGDFANIITHPSHSIKKTYEAHVRGNIVIAEKLLEEPMEIDSHIVRAETVKLVKHSTDG